LPADNSRKCAYIREERELTLTRAGIIVLLRAVVDRGASLRFQASGCSMFPFIKNGDVLTVSPLDSASLRRGDVVAFSRPETGKLVVHRIVGKRDGLFLIKGDNAPEADGLVAKAGIAGLVTRVERNGKGVNFGLGRERFLIAYCSHRDILMPLFRYASRIARPVVRRGAA